MAKIWVLTRSHNEYYQEGEYFVAAFLKKPDVETLVKCLKEKDEYRVCDFENVMNALDYILYLQKGGGRIKHEDVWYNLIEEETY